MINIISRKSRERDDGSETRTAAAVAASVAAKEMADPVDHGGE